MYMSVCICICTIADSLTVPARLSCTGSFMSSVEVGDDSVPQLVAQVINLLPIINIDESSEEPR